MIQSYEKLFRNNKKWVTEKLGADPDYFKKLSQGQEPLYLFIGCSDSRITANEITGTDAGELFVHRNIANIVVHTDLNVMSVLQYSVEVLKVKHVIVCGHYGCGGVKAAMEKHPMGLIDEWLRNIKDVYRIYRTELDAITNENEQLRRLVELNVREQVYHIAMTSILQNAWANGQQVAVHGWVYDIAEGYLNDLNIDIEKDFGDLDIYMYDRNPAILKQQDSQ